MGLSLKGINTKFPTCKKQKIEKINTKKNNHTHKIVFIWFSNLSTSTELQRFHYYQKKKKYKCDNIVFFLSLKKLPRQNPNHQCCIFYIMHFLSLKKSPIKNYAKLFWVRSSSGSNATRLHKVQHSLAAGSII